MKVIINVNTYAGNDNYIFDFLRKGMYLVSAD